MLKFVTTQMVFKEIPDEVTLAINISNCPCHCPGCHSSYLAEDIGKPLDMAAIDRLMERYRGVTVIAFMGGDASPKEVDRLAAEARRKYPEVKTAWYSGRERLAEHIHLDNFDFIKLGPYIAEKGGLASRTTNQRLYWVHEGSMVDITWKFWV